MKDITPYVPDLLLSNKLVVDKEVSQRLAYEERISPDLGFPFGTIANFNAHAEGSFSVELFNDISDHKDKDGIEDKTLKYWPEVSNLYGNGALLGYSLNGKLKASIAGTVLGRFDLGIDAEQSLQVKSYRYHDENTIIRNAFLSDIKKFKIIFDKTDIIDYLAKNEALSLQAAGKVEVNATVKWSDVLSGTATVISSFLNLNGKINLKAEAAVSLSFKVAIEDDFQVVFIKLAEDNYRVVIGKVIKRSYEIGAKAGITAQIVDDKNLKELADQFFEGIDQIVFKEVNRLIDASILSDDNLELVQQAALLLGWNFPISSVGDFKTKYTDLRDTGRKKLVEIATTKIEVGIGYEYKRIQTTESLYTAELTKNGVKEHFDKIIALKVGDLVNLGNTADLNLKSYFKRITEEVNSSFGINFAFGKFQLSAGTKKSFKETTDFIKAEKDKIKVSLYNRETTKTYKSGIVAKDEYSLRFSADMSTFVSDKSQLTAEKFDFDFGISAEKTDKRLSRSKKELYEAVDWALTWDIINQNQFQETFESIENNVIKVDNHTIEYKMFLNIAENESGNSNLFDLLLPKIATATDQTIASALAAAVPYADFTGTSSAKRIRTDLRLRRERYYSFWLTYIQKYFNDQKGSSPDSFRANVQDLLSKYFYDQGLEDLAQFESTPQQYPTYGSATIGEILFTNFVGSDIQHLRNGFGFLNDGINRRSYYSKPFEQFNQQASLIKFQREFNLRFIGRLILDLADEINIKSKINRGFSIVYQENGVDKVFVVA